jgi:hypothetical protein
MILNFLFAAVCIQILLVIILGYRNRATRLRYWAIAAIELVVFAVSWLALVISIDLVVWTHVSLPVEDKFIAVDTLSILSYLGLTILLAFIEIHRGTPRSGISEQRVTTEINDN